MTPKLNALFALMMLATPAVAQTTSADGASVDAGGQITAPTTDAEFVKMATSSNILEIQSSQLAQQQAKSDAVKTFAAQMVSDHTAASQQLAQAAGTEPLDMTTDQSALLDPHHAEQMQTLTSAQGDGFDQAYIDLQTKAHEEAVALFQSYATNGQEGAVKDFAEATLPKLQQHFEMVKGLAGQ